MSEPLIIPLYPTVEHQATVPIATRAASSAPPGRPPLFVPRSQLYYWTREWQAGEKVALRELAEGNYVAFDNGADAAAWLLSDEDDDED